MITDYYNIIMNFVGKKVVVIGDIMVDEYIVSEISEIRESPSDLSMPLVLCSKNPSPDSDFIRLGGAGNTARNLASFGAEVILIGICGDNFPISEQLMNIAASHSKNSFLNDKLKSQQYKHRFNIDCHIIRQPGLITTHKLRVLNNQYKQLFRVDTEIYQNISDATFSCLIELFYQTISWCDIIVVSDYDKGLITTNLFKVIREISKEKRIIVNPKQHTKNEKFFKYVGADIIIPNEKELLKSFGGRRSLIQLFSGDLQRQLNEISIQYIMCTRGDKGIIFSEADTNSFETVMGSPVNVFDTTGASDTVTATTALCFSQLESLSIAAKIAESAGRLKVTKPLTDTVQIFELLNIMDPFFHRRASSKLIFERDEFVRACLLHKNLDSPQKLAFITGCFDILHRGHLKLIEFAAERADIVAVAVNSDNYIRRMPHKIGGPYLDEISRATLIASLACVDLVTIFDEDTPEILISKISPSLLVMGEEYKQKYLNGILPGISLIHQLGIEVHCVGWDETREFSSSSIANRIWNLRMASNLT